MTNSKDKLSDVLVKTVGYGAISLTNSDTFGFSDICNNIMRKTGWGKDEFWLINNGKYIDTNVERLDEMLYFHEFIECKHTSLTFWACLKSKVESVVYLKTKVLQADDEVQDPNHKTKLEFQSTKPFCKSLRVLDIKTHLYKSGVCDLNPNSQKIVYKGKILQDHELIGEYVNSVNEHNAAKIVILRQPDISRDIQLNIMLPGGGMYKSSIGRRKTVLELKKFLQKSNLFAILGGKFNFYEQNSRRLLNNGDSLSKYDFGETATLLAVPDIGAFVDDKRIGKSLSSLSGLSIKVLPSAVDIFFPPVSVDAKINSNQVKSKTRFPPRLTKPTSSSLFKGFRKGFFGDDNHSKYNKILSVKKNTFENANNNNNNDIESVSGRSNESNHDLKNETITTKSLNNNTSHSTRSCEVCSKRLPLGMEIAGKCRCGIVCCSLHMHPPNHNCTYDFKLLEKTKLRSMNTRITAPKVNRI